LFCKELSLSGSLLRSVLVPGWGELRLGEEKRAKVLLMSELAIWTSFFMGRSLSDSFIDEYEALAVLNAGADIRGKEYSYILDLSNYNTMDLYNHDMDLQRNWDERYDDSSYNWNWDSQSNRFRFNDLRKKSIVYQDISEFAIAGMIINRILSAIDVIYLNSRNRRVKMFSYVKPDHNDGMRINLLFTIK
tara:strand:+ start:41 stop:610 length:570 start_codon:yes stop_codon:yes gene_type:complete